MATKIETAPTPVKLNNEAAGFGLGFIGMLCFSLTLPATRVAVGELSPLFIGLGRSVVAGILATIILKLTRQHRPSWQQLKSLAVVAVCVGIGFPYLTAWAMSRLPASHGAITLGLIPLATALVSTFRSGERPSRMFWIASVIGSSAVIFYAFMAGAGELQLADLALIGAVLSAAIGYTEGGRLSRDLGSWQVISWAMAMVAPLSAALLSIELISSGTGNLFNASPTAWLCFAYVAIISQYIGFFAWYGGMALGGVARVSQLQLLQPFFTLLSAVVLLGEQITLFTIIVSLVVVGTVAIGRKAPIGSKHQPHKNLR